MDGAWVGGRYLLRGQLGRGADSVVWLAEDRAAGGTVALRVLDADVPSPRTRLQHAHELGARVGHPDLVAPSPPMDLDGPLLGRVGAVMPLARGRQLLDQVRAQGPFAEEPLKQIGRNLAEVLGAAHRVGVVLRDLRPEHVFVREDGGVSLVGLHHAGFAGSVRSIPSGATVAPEVAVGAAPDPRQDLFGLGVVLWTAATGAAPPPGRAPSLSSLRPDLSPDVTRLVDALLDPDPSDRPAGARDVLDLLSARVPPRDVLRGRPAREPRHHLPPGAFVVRLTERPRDARRRKRRRKKGDRLWATLARAARKALAEVLDVSEFMPPEERVVAAVAAAAGLPSDALRVPKDLLKRKVRLVEGVDRTTAARLADAARAAGFRAEVHEVAAPVGPGVVAVLQPLLTGLAMAAAFAAAGLPTVLVAFVAALGAGIALMAALSGLTRAPASKRDDPLVFGADLRPHLRGAYRDALPPPPLPAAPATASTTARRPPQRKATEAAAPPTAAPTTAPAAAAGSAGPASPVLDVPPEPVALAALARGRLRRLADDLAADRDLPAPTRADVRAGLEALTAEVDALEAALSAPAETLAPALVAARQRVLAELEDRLARMDALAAGGASVDASERAAVSRALDAARAEAAAVEVAASQRVRRLARLLELGSVANEVRRDLFDRSTPSPPVQETVAQLRQDIASGRAALDEAADGRRRHRAATGAQRQ